MAREAIFQGSLVFLACDFDKVVFEASLDWSDAHFQEEQKFDSTYFGGEASFVRTRFYQGAVFEDVVFDEIDFWEADMLYNLSPKTA